MNNRKASKPMPLVGADELLYISKWIGEHLDEVRRVDRIRERMHKLLYSHPVLRQEFEAFLYANPEAAGAERLKRWLDDAAYRHAEQVCRPTLIIDNTYRQE